MYATFAPIIWVAVLLFVLFLIERWIHRHMQGIAFLITGSVQWSVMLYALILFPGVLLHLDNYRLTEFRRLLPVQFIGHAAGKVVGHQKNIAMARP